MSTRKLTTIYIILFVIIAAVALDIARAAAQGATSAALNVLTFDRITGRSPAFIQPIALLYTPNPTAALSLEMGAILRDRAATSCDLVLLAPENPLAGSPVGLFAYCLQLTPGERVFPTAAADYELTTARVSPEILAILERISQAEGQSDYAAQLAVWQAYLGLSLPELQARLGAQDLQSYAAVINAYLLPPAATLPLTPPDANILAAANAAPIWRDKPTDSSPSSLHFGQYQNWHDLARWTPLGFTGVLVIGWLVVAQRRLHAVPTAPKYREYAPAALPEHDCVVGREFPQPLTLSLLPTTAPAPSLNPAPESQTATIHQEPLSSYAHTTSPNAAFGAERALIDDQYQLEAWVGNWGGSEVYRVRDWRTETTYLMKVCPTKQPRALQREFEISSLLHNQHFLRVHRLGSAAGWGSYSLLEDLDAQSLAAYVRQRGSLSLSETLAIVAQIGQALTYLHRIGLVHGALSPETVLLTAPSKIYLTNLSHATPLDSIPAFPLYADGHQSCAGICEYAAPETVVPIPATPSVDIYALGAVTFNLLTGESAKHLPEPARTLMKFVDNAGLIAVIMKCLHEQPRRRYQQVTEILERLAIFQHTRQDFRSL